MLIVRRTKDRIILSMDGKPYTLPKTDETLAKVSAMEEADENGTLTVDDVSGYVATAKSQVIAGSNEFLHYNPGTQQYFLCVDKKVSKHAIPSHLVEFIEESFDKDIDFMPIIKAWARFLSNPRYDATKADFFNKYLNATFVDTDEIERLMEEEDFEYDAARNLATYQDLAITKEGLLATYKVAQVVEKEWAVKWDEEAQEYIKYKKPLTDMIPPVIDPVTGKIKEEAKFAEPKFKEDYIFTPAICTNGDEFYSDQVLGYVYKVGEMQWLPKDAKRNLSNTFGGGGLYSGGLNYVKGYRSCGSHVLTCFINPADILSFQDDGQALRTDALMPNNILDNDVKLKSIYHSSEYDKMSTERLEALIAADIAEKGELAKKLTKQIMKGEL